MHPINQNIIAEYAKKYPSAGSENIDALFRYSPYNPEQIERHKKLLTDGWLFHNLPCNFNDPFELKPNIKWPDKNSFEEAGLKSDMTMLYQLEYGILNEPDTRQFTKDTKKRDVLEKRIIGEYQRQRVCCFQTSHENPLSWAHYADSHRGYCVKFSGKGKVISQARRINYTDNYPELTFPLLSQLTKFLGPILTKSKVWGYENEYRSVFNPNHDEALKNFEMITF